MCHQEIKEKLKNLETNENQNVTPKYIRCSKSSSKREIHAHLKKQGKYQIANITLHLKELSRKRTKPENSGR